MKLKDNEARLQEARNLFLDMEFKDVRVANKKPISSLTFEDVQGNKKLHYIKHSKVLVVYPKHIYNFEKYVPIKSFNQMKDIIAEWFVRRYNMEVDTVEIGLF